MSGFKLYFESQFDILFAIFCYNFSLCWCCSWQTKKKKGIDQDLTKYLINDCSPFWNMHVCVLVYGLPGSTPPPTTKKEKKWTQGGLCICRDGSLSTFSEFIDF